MLLQIKLSSYVCKRSIKIKHLTLLLQDIGQKVPSFSLGSTTHCTCIKVVEPREKGGTFWPIWYELYLHCKVSDKMRCHESCPPMPGVWIYLATQFLQIWLIIPELFYCFIEFQRPCIKFLLCGSWIWPVYWMLYPILGEALGSRAWSILKVLVKLLKYKHKHNAAI